jgi:hypothetical protein
MKETEASLAVVEQYLFLSLCSAFNYHHHLCSAALSKTLQNLICKISFLFP